MFVILKSADGEMQRYPFDSEQVNEFEAIGIEKETGWTWGEFGDRLNKNSALAIKALLWTVQKRVHHNLKFADVHFTMGQVSVEPEPQELTAARDAVIEDRKLDDHARAARLEEIYEQMDAVGVPRDTPAPKAPAKSVASDTSAR